MFLFSIVEIYIKIIVITIENNVSKTSLEKKVFYGKTLNVGTREGGSAEIWSFWYNGSEDADLFR